MSWTTSKFAVMSLLCALGACIAATGALAAGSHAGLHVIRVTPVDDDAKDYADPAWGGNIDGVFVPPGMADVFAFEFGVEGARLDSKTVEFIDRITGLRVEQQTNQDYFRVYMGGRLGHQGHGFLRPYVGASLSMDIFTINTDVVIPDDTARENEIRQNLKSKTEVALGYHFDAGLELNFNDVWYIDVGAKYIESFNVPAQLGADAKTIYPTWVEGYLGAGVFFSVFQ